jgi:hypothetical protein
MSDLYRYYLDGPGEVLVTAVDFDFANPDVKKILIGSTCKNASIQGSATLEPVTGGRSLFPRRKILTDRALTFSMEDCEMDFRYLSMTQGEDIVVGVANAWAFGEDEQYTIPSATAYTVTLKHIPLAGTLAVLFDDGKIGDPVAIAPAATLEFQVTAAVVTFNAVYQYAGGATSSKVSTLSTSLPKAVKIIHKQTTYNSDNVVTGTQYVELFKVQPSPEFEEAYAEKQAYAPKLTFELIDPQRADKKIMDHIFIPA